MKAFLVYNVVRLGLLAAAFGLLFAVGFRGAPLVFGALLASGAASWFLLGRQRVAVAEGVEGYVQGKRARLRERTAAEDAAADALLAQASADRPEPVER